MKRRNSAGRVLGLTLAFIGLMGWVTGADYASSRPTPSGSAASSQRPTSSGVNVWNSLGPDEEIRALAVDPSNPKTLYAGSEGQYITAGEVILHKSTDGGASWKDSGTGAIASYGWAINPADPQIVLAPGDVYGGSPPLISPMAASSRARMAARTGAPPA